MVRIAVIEKVRTAVFFAAANGAEPLRRWLRSLSEADRKAIGTDIARVEYGAALKMPLVGHLGDGLWEIRTHLRRGRIARVFFSLTGSEMILLHGIVKKSMKTPANELKTARRRKREWETDDASKDASKEESP